MMIIIDQIHSRLVVGGAKVDFTNMDDYNLQGAIADFYRVSRDHRWKAPKLTF